MPAAGRQASRGSEANVVGHVAGVVGIGRCRPAGTPGVHKSYQTHTQVGWTRAGEVGRDHLLPPRSHMATHQCETTEREGRLVNWVRQLVPASALIGLTWPHTPARIARSTSIQVLRFFFRSKERAPYRSLVGTNAPAETGERTSMRIGHLKSNRSAHIMCEQRKRFGWACIPRSISACSTPILNTEQRAKELDSLP
jgi:hypothetical protein